VQAVTILLASTLLAQAASGELRLAVTDATGLPVVSAVQLTSDANQYDEHLTTDSRGRLIATRLPFGLYRIQVQRAGFSLFSDAIEIRSPLPREFHVVLSVAPVATEMTIMAGDTLLDGHRTGTINRTGSETLVTRPTSLPGRSFLDVVSTQPGWLLEANGVLHPRGSEYQVQYVVDGIPLTDNRSPAFLADPDADDVASLTVLTGNYPAEYGRKLGGIVEVVTAKQAEEGLHGRAVLYGGSLGTVGGSVLTEYGQGRNTLQLSTDGGRTNRFLDPPVLENFTNRGATINVAARYEREMSDADRAAIGFRHEDSRFLVPNEHIQEAAGQRQDREAHETSGQFSYQHVFSADVIGDVRGLARDLSAALWSNPASTPIVAGQDRGYREAYAKGAVTIHAGVHDLKVGGEADFASISEVLDYQITDPSAFDPSTPPIFHFDGRSPDREQALFVQDTLRVRNWTFSTGLRWDHYSVLVDETAWSPRLGLAHYWPGADIVLRASYDRVFQTPAFENLLVASSAAVEGLSDQVLRLPVQPSRGNFYEVGLSKALWRKVRVDINAYRRDFTNYADDDLLLNTGVSFPIAFRRATIQGQEVKLETPRLGRVSGALSYSHMVGTGFLPVTGGLFIGVDAANAISTTTGSFPVSQDQRHTFTARVRDQVTDPLWVAVGVSFGSGLPTAFQGQEQDAVAQYGQDIVDRVDFLAGRVRPSFSLDASASLTLRKTARQALRMQADVVNLTDRLNLINFAGLFSGTALGSPRRIAVRLNFDF
jgi:hypothetical protein